MSLIRDFYAKRPYVTIGTISAVIFINNWVNLVFCIK